jgi:Immunity protein Imm1
MARQQEELERLTLTASLTTGVARVTHGMRASVRMIDEILNTDHVDWETTLYVGDVEYHSTKHGPYPNHQLRISVRPSAGFAAINYVDHDDPEMSVANSSNPKRPPPEVDLIFNGATGTVFPRTAAIPITEARDALHEWLRTWKRPTCIEWRPYDEY